jgi:hypothetical protein
MTQFLKSTEVTVKNGGYLFSKAEKPVRNEEFENIQRHAEYIITLSEKLEGKDLKGSKPVNIQDIKNEVIKALNKDKTIEFIALPSKVKLELGDQLKEEALAFLNNQDEISKTEKINDFLQKFKILKQYEEFGLFFEDGISVRLTKIYTLEEVVGAVKRVISYLD